MTVTKEEYGRTSSDQLVEQFTLTNGNGMIVKLINYGAAMTELWVPDRNNKVADVVLGWADLEGYQKHPVYLSVVVGRVANRIAKGCFTLNNEKYELAINNGPNHLHGGLIGFSKVFWNGSIEEDGVKFTYLSPDGEEGYPGELTASITYQLTDDNKVVLTYAATTTKPTPVNLTNHSYFNLAGHDSGSILGHEIAIDAECYTPVDDTSIPTGEIAPVKNSAFDLLQAVKIGDLIHDVPGGVGFDHNYCITSSLEKPFARVSHPGSGRCMEAFTTKPGVQFYTGNYLNETMVGGKGGATYAKHSGLCLESQYYPDSINQPNFPNCILNPGETYKHVTVYKFSWS